MEIGAGRDAYLIMEERARGQNRRLRGRFPYNRRAVLSDGGRKGGKPQKEEFKSLAFNYRIEKPDENIFLLVGHDYGQPLASKEAGTLDIKDSPEAVTFVAEIKPEIEETTWAKDAFAQMKAGLVGGISPGFRLPPPSAVPEPEVIRPEPPSEGRAMIRTILAALLYEFSLVTLPAYDETEIAEEEGEEPEEERSAGGIILPRRRALAVTRWR